MKYILVINPGSTSTKLAIYDHDLKEIAMENLSHCVEELKPFDTLWDQYEFRLKAVENFLREQKFSADSFEAVVGRGGLLKPIPGGTYAVCSSMLEKLKEATYGEHASNLGAPLAYHLATKFKTPSYIVDPVIVDELAPLARYSGHPKLPKKSIFHALGQKAAGKLYAKTVNKNYDQLNLIIAHMGGGITVGVHQNGRVIDVNNGLDGEGPFSPERTGTLPVGQLLQLAFSGDYTHDQVKKMVKGEGGLVAYLGESDARVIEKRIEEGEQKALEVYSAMAYEVAKSISALGAVVNGKVDAIILSGGLAKSKVFTKMLTERISYLAPVHINLEECEMSALALGAKEALTGQSVVMKYF